MPTVLNNVLNIKTEIAILMFPARQNSDADSPHQMPQWIENDDFAVLPPISKIVRTSG